jgi:endonuclease/exonuclease/phosphatase family metal-dependent hydrolase
MLTPQSDLSLRVWVLATEAAAETTFPSLVTDKDWDGGALEDFTSHHAFGWSRSTGSEPGWVLALSPEGSWIWNIGDGDARLDYQPTVGRQPVADGRWHCLGFTIEHATAEARLYYDGRCVAVYSLSGMKDCRGAIAPVVSATASCLLEDLVIESGAVWPATVIARAWEERTGGSVDDGMRKERVEDVGLLAWNIWHGGRRDGNSKGLEATITAIRNSGADIVVMQETYGSGAHIADGLGYCLYLRSSNLSILSRFPIRETYDLFQPFNFGGVCLELSPGQSLRVFSTWLHYLPDYGSLMQTQAAVTAAALLAAENETRASEAGQILIELAAMLKSSDETPVIVAGDFNSPSHLDWGQDTAPRHRDLVVEWPTSRMMQEAGFVDVFRRLHPDAAADPGYTWSPRFAQSWKDRIDYIYTHGAAQPVASRVIDQHQPRWPSDHAAVWAALRLPSVVEEQA